MVVLGWNGVNSGAVGPTDEPLVRSVKAWLSSTRPTFGSLGRASPTGVDRLVTANICGGTDMDFPRTADDVDALVGTMNSILGDIATTLPKATALTATAAELDGRVRVSVNARGIVTETAIDEDALTTVTAARLGAAITAAAQAAAHEVGTKAQEVWAPITEAQRSMPRASDILDGLPDISTMFGVKPEPPLTPPHHEPTDAEVYVELEHPATTDDEPYFEDAQDATAGRGPFTDRAW